MTNKKLSGFEKDEIDHTVSFFIVFNASWTKIYAYI